ncbi:MAG: hypothetical protein AAFQ73_10155 [Pseudomonadota bacterium]
MLRLDGYGIDGHCLCGNWEGEMWVNLSRFKPIFPVFVAVAGAFAAVVASEVPAYAVDCQNPQCRVMVTDSCLARRASVETNFDRFQRSKCGRQYQRYRNCVELVVSECGSNPKTGAGQICSAPDASRRWQSLLRSEDTMSLLVFAEECRKHPEARPARERVELLETNRIKAEGYDAQAKAERRAKAERAMQDAADYIPATVGARDRLETRLIEGWKVGHAVVDAFGPRFVYREEATRALCDELFEETCPGFVTTAPPVTFAPVVEGDAAVEDGGSQDAPAAPVVDAETATAPAVQPEQDADTVVAPPAEVEESPLSRTRRLFGD